MAIMHGEIRDELDPPFEILEPQTCGAVLFNSPQRIDLPA
jgi:hypothetical protein